MAIYSRSFTVLKRYSIAEARDHFTALIHKEEKDAAVEVTRRGKPVAVIMSVQEYQQLQAEKVGFWQAFDSFRVMNSIRPYSSRRMRPD